MGLWNMETRSDAIGVAIGKRERHANVGSVAGQNIKHIGGRVHPNVLADMAEGRTMGFVCPDGFHAGVGIGSFKIQSPCFQMAANGRWKRVHTLGIC